MPLPWIIGAVAVAAVTAVASSSSSSRTVTTTTSNRAEIENDAKEEENDKLIDEISTYKDKMSAYLEKNYNIIILFDYKEEMKRIKALIDGGSYYINPTNASNIKILSENHLLKDSISELSIEVNELNQLKKELEEMRNETLS